MATCCLGLGWEISQVPGSLSCLKKRTIASKAGWGIFTSSCSAPETLMDPFTSCSKNVPYFPSVFSRQALSLLLVDVLSYISMSPSAQLLNKGMERFKNGLKLQAEEGAGETGKCHRRMQGVAVSKSKQQNPRAATLQIRQRPIFHPSACRDKRNLAFYSH